MATLAHALHDDALFAALALALLNGDWLGSYTSLTLVKGPFYSMWLAFNALLGAPLLVSQAVLYLLAGLLLLWAVAPGPRWRWPLVIGFAIYAFNPAPYAVAELRVLRAGIYVPLSVLILALCFCWFRVRDEAWRRKLPVAAALGLTVGCFWITREEGVWILPALALAWSGVVATRWRMAATEAGLAAVAAAIAIFVVQGVATVNYVKYGVHDVVEFKQREFLDAYGALSRIDHAAWRPRIVVPREVWARAYDVSPAFAELRPHLGGAVGDFWANESCQYGHPIPCPDEIAGGWFMFALREAVARAGHYESATKARAYYARVATELNGACDDGRLACSARRRSMAPPYRSHYARDTLARLWRATQYLAGLDGLLIDPGRSTGPQVEIDLIADLINMRPFPRERSLVMRGNVTSTGAPITAVRVDGGGDGWQRTDIDRQDITMEGSANALVTFDLRTNCLRPECGLVILGPRGPLARVPLLDLSESVERGPITIRLTEVLGPEPYRPSEARATRALWVLRGVARAYRAVLPAAAWLALALYGVSFLHMIWTRRIGILVFANTVLLTAMASRLSLLSYVDVTAIPAISTNYLSPIYPALVLFCLFALADGARLLARVFGRRSVQTTA